MVVVGAEMAASLEAGPMAELPARRLFPPYSVSTIVMLLLLHHRRPQVHLRILKLKRHLSLKYSRRHRYPTWSLTR